MEAVLHELYRPYLSDLSFRQKELPRNFKRCGLYLEPDPGFGEGYCWIYPAGELYAIDTQHLMLQRRLYPEIRSSRLFKHRLLQ